MLALRFAIRDFIELFAIPALVALLPWAAGFRLIRAISRRGWFYREEAHIAWRLAAPVVAGQDETEWVRRYCFTRVMDHADLFISLTRSRRWVERQIVNHGAWPHSRPFVSMTIHWGNGLMALRSLQHAVGPFAGVALAVDRAQFKGRPVRYAYVRLRNWETARAIGGGLNYTGSAARGFVTAIERGISICGLFDVPPLPTVKSALIPFLGGMGIFPRGAARLAARHNVPLVIFRSITNPDSGIRELWIDSITEGLGEAEMMKTAVRDLESAIRSQPFAWHMWTALPSFLKQA